MDLVQSIFQGMVNQRHYLVHIYQPNAPHKCYHQGILTDIVEMGLELELV